MIKAFTFDIYDEILVMGLDAGYEYNTIGKTVIHEMISRETKSNVQFPDPLSHCVKACVAVARQDI